MINLLVANNNPYSYYNYRHQSSSFKGVQPYTNVSTNSISQEMSLDIQPDTFSFSAQEQIQRETQKKSLSKSAKIGISTITVIGLGALVYGLTKGKLGSSSIKQLTEHIDFQKANTIEEAKAFAKNNLGVKLKFEDVEMANYVNEALVTINNRTKGRSIMPNSVFVDKAGINGNAFFAWRRYSNKASDLILSPKAYKLGSIAREKNMTVKDLYTNALWKDNRFKEKGLSPFKELFHELGHGNHEATCNDYRKMAKLKELTLRGINDTHYTEEFIEETKNNNVVKDFFKNVGYMRNDGSIYALESPAEYVADVFSLKVQGKSIPEEVQKIYTKYGGPEIF